MAGTYTGTISLGSHALTAAQVSFAGGTFNGENGSLTCTGSFALAGGVFNAPPTLTLKGNVDFSGGYFNHNDGQTFFAVNYNSTQSISVGTAAFKQVGIKGHGASTTTINGDLTVLGDLAFGMTNYAGNRVNGGRILAHGDVRMESANFGGGTTTVVFAGDGDQTLDGATAGRFPNKKVEKPSGVLHLAGAPQVFGNWEFVSAGGLDAGTTVLTLATPYNTEVNVTGGPVTYGDVVFKGWGQNSKHNLVGDFRVGGDLDLDMVAYSGNQIDGASFIVSGDVRIWSAGFGAASWGPGTSTIKLVGAGNHVIAAYAAGHFPNMLIDTAGSVTTEGDVIVSGDWTLANGTFTQGAGTVLEFQAPYAKTQTIAPGNATYGDVRIEGDGLSNQNVAGVLRCQNFTLSTRAYSGAKLNDGIIEVLGDFTLLSDGFGNTDGGPGTAWIRLAGTGAQAVTAGGLARCPSLNVASTGTVTFVGPMRLGAHYTHTSGNVVAAGSAQAFVGRQDSLVSGNAVFGDLSVQKGPYGSSYKVTLAGAVAASGGLTLTEGILEWAKDASLSVAGNVSVGASNVGVIAGENSTLILNGSAAQNVNLAAKSVFNLSVANVGGAVSFTGPYTAKGTTSAAPGSALVFASGQTFQPGKLAMNGTAAAPIVLRALAEGAAANIVAAPYQFVRFADIKDLDASAGPKIVAVHSTDSGNNTNIVFQQEALLAISTGASSLTSPAWVEGLSGPDVTSLTVAVDGGAAFDANRLNPTQWFAANNASGLALGVNLSASAPTHVDVTAQNEFGESAVVSQDIAWEPTELSGKSYSTDAVKIRIGSKLRFVLDDGDGEPGEAVRIDLGNDGSFEFEGAEGDNFEHLFDAAGAVVVRGEVGGLLFGSITVIVVSTDLHPPVACHVDYERNLQVYTLPVTEAANIAYAAADPYELGLTLSQVTSDGADLKLKPTAMDNPSFVSRLGAGDGPIVSIQPLTVFRIVHLNKHDFGLAVDDAGYGHGFIKYQIVPRTVIDNDNPVTPEQEGLFFHLQCSGSSMVFAENGLSTLKVHSNRQDENGIFEAEVLLNPNATFVCNGIQPKQTNSGSKAVGPYTYSNPCVLKARGGLYLHREMSDETTREGKTNLYPEGHAEEGKQIFQVWDQDVPKDMRWTDEIVAADFTPQALEAAFFAPKAKKPALPNRWFTVEVTEPGSSLFYAVRMQPGTTGIKGGDSIEDNTGVNRDEVLYQRESENQNYLKWEGGFPSAYPALNLPPNHWDLDYQDPAKLYKSWDDPFQRYSTSKFYTDIGFWKGNMIGKMTVWATCNPVKSEIQRQAVRPNQRPGAPANPHTNATDSDTSTVWGGQEAEFRDILRFGRLEADGWRGEMDESGNTVIEDKSSRDAFPDVVGANVFEVEAEIQVPDPQNPGQTMPKTVTYLRTEHEGNTGKANPIPVQITFRAPPGESVNVGVAIARRAERDDDQSPENELDRDGKKTHRAWVHLSDTAIFESRGQPEDDEDAKATKVVEILAINQDGEIAQEKSAERVVKFSMTADSTWFATKLVYIYGIEPSERLDDLKLVVWGEEVVDWKAYSIEDQTHHHQFTDLENPLPIRRWYITDEEPMNVVRLEVVVPVTTTDNALPEPTTERLISATVPVSEPHPTVALDEISEYDVTIAGETAHLSIGGMVKDAIADNTPRGKVSDGLADIENAVIFVDGEEVNTAEVVSDTDGIEAFWRQHPYKGIIQSATIPVPIAPGNREITVKTSLNAAGYEGSDSVSVAFSSQTLPGGSIDAANSVLANIFLPLAPTPTVNDSLQYYFGQRDPGPDDPVFTESAGAIANENPILLAVVQPFDPGSIDTVSLFLKPRKLPVLSIELAGPLDPMQADEIVLHASTESIVLVEDGLDTGNFTGNSADFGTVALGLVETPNPDPGILTRAKGTISFSGMDTGAVRIANRGSESFSFVESGLQTNVLLAYHEIELTEDRPDSLAFSAESARLGKVRVQVLETTGLSPEISDTVKVAVAVQRLWPGTIPYTMLETLPDSKLFAVDEDAMATADTLVFYGKVEGTPARITLKDFSGLTPVIDTFEGEVAYLFGDGGVAVLRVQFVETEPQSNLFRAVLQVVGGTADTPQRVWSVTSVTNHVSTPLVSYVPMTVRLASYLTPRDLAISLGDFPNLIGLEEVSRDGAFYLDGGSVSIVVVVADPNDPAKVAVIYYDKKLNELLKFSLPRDALLSWKLARENNPLLKLAKTDATILKIDLSVDANRNASPDDGLDDDKGEEAWEYGPGKKGAIILNNNDDDAEFPPSGVGPPIQNGIVDNGQGPFGTADANRVNGPDDVQDLAPLVIRQVVKEKLPPGWKVVLKLREEKYKDRIRIFDGRAEDANPIIGPTPGHEYEIPDPTQTDLVYGMEAIGYADHDFDGEIGIQLILRDPAGNVRAKDDVSVRVAPWLMLDNLDETERVFVVTLPGNAAFRTELRSAVPPQIPITEIDGSSYQDDRWVQDEFEIGYSKTPFIEQSVVFKSPRDGGLVTFPREHLQGPNFGWFEKGSDRDSGSFFGNLEVSFPVTTGGKEYPFGRIVYGSNMDPEIKVFLKEQKMQAPFEIDVSWLLVGHVDEVIGFINTCNGPKVLIASPLRAIQILRDLQQAGKGDVRLYAGKRDPLDQSITVGRTVDEILGDDALREFNTVSTALAIEKVSLKVRVELNLAAEDIIEVPVLFFENTRFGKTGAEALTGNMVNMLVVDGNLIVPDPFGPLDGTVDKFREALLNSDAACNAIHFVDSWDVYHLHAGEIHCGTNVERKPPANLPWWNHKP